MNPVLLLAALAAAAPEPATNLSVNGDFEEVVITGERTLPAGWRTAGEGVAAIDAGRDGSVGVMAAGGGDDSSEWLSDPVPAEPGGLYEFSVWCRADGGTRGGSAVAGVVGCSRDFTPAEEWSRFSFVFRAPDGVEEVQIRLGQWRVDGRVYYDGVRMVPVEAIHKTVDGIAFGEGEWTEGNQYNAEHRMEGRASNNARFLEYADARFNSNRWVFGNGERVAYRHVPPAGAIVDGSARININHYTAGVCKVSARGESREWFELGEWSGTGAREMPLPDGLMDGGFAEIRIEGAADGSGRCGFQIDEYRFTAELSPPPPAATGATRHAAVIRDAGELMVTLKDLGDPKPWIESQMTVLVSNRYNRRRPFRVRVRVEGEETTLERSRQITLDPLEGRTVEFPYELRDTGPNTVTLEILGRGRDPLYASEVHLSVPFLRAGGYGELVHADETAAIWWCRSMHKVSRDRPAPRRGKDEVHLSAARGEFESAQIVLRPETPFAKLDIEATPLEGPEGFQIPSGRIAVREVAYVFVSDPSDGWGSVDAYPDPLPEIEEPLKLAKGVNQPFWYTVRVPRTAPAGEYEGTVVFREAGWRRDVPVRLRVYDFEIPDRPALQTAFGFDLRNVKRYHKLETDEQLRVVADLYYRNFREHRVSPYNPLELYPAEWTLEEGADGRLRYTFDFGEFDRGGARYFDEFGFTSLRLRLEGLGGGTFHSRREGEIAGHAQGTEEHERLFGEFASAMQGHLEDKGWLDEAYVYWFDEPAEGDYDFVREGMDLIHRHAPKLDRFLTEQPEPALFGFVDTWCPILDHFEPETARERQEAGEEVWWYICTAPKAPYPGLFIDHPGADLRAWIWMTHQFGLDGCLVWQSNYWTSGAAFPGPEPQDPWSDPASYVSGYGREPGTRKNWGNGDGRFIYPPRNWREEGPKIRGPVDSIRWEILRDGIEDYAYFEAVKMALKSGNLSFSQRNRAVQLLNAPDSVIESPSSYSKDPEAYYAHRESMAEFIEETR